MPFHIRSKCFPAEISSCCINTIARSDTPPEVSLWEKIKAFFCLTNKPEALALIRQICHPPDGTEWEAVTGKFEQLKTLTYGGFKESVQVGRNGENHACILDENGDEMLSVTLEKNTGKYTVKCQGYSKTNHLNPTGGWEAELAISAEDASETLWTDHSVTAAPQTAQGYEAIWAAWEKAAPAGEAFSRAAAVQKMRNCLYNDKTELKLEDLKLTSLPDYLPPDITVLNTTDVPLNYLPELPAGLNMLMCNHNRLTRRPENITALSRTAYINISDNPISESESRTPDTMPRPPHPVPAPRAPRPVPCTPNPRPDPTLRTIRSPQYISIINEP